MIVRHTFFVGKNKYIILNLFVEDTHKEVIIIQDDVMIDQRWTDAGQEHGTYFF